MIDEVFPGTSEMARRMRELDWSRTTLGPVEGWPQALRTTVSTSLDCGFPIVVWWGPELSILYNDEYRQILGPKDPDALGQPGAKVSTEIWDVIRPMLEQVIERGEATRSRDLLLHVDRGHPEEAYFSFSYSPIRDEGGTVGGVFCPLVETTDKVIGERRLRTLRDLAARCQGAVREAAVYEAAAAVLGANLHDVPFSLIYRVDDNRAAATLAAAAGIGAGSLGAAGTVALDGTGAQHATDDWSLAAVVGSGRPAVLTDLESRFAALPAGAWKTQPHSAMVLPVSLPGQAHPRAVLIAAVSPMRALDDDYRTFFSLVATQIASGLADAQALEEERRRGEALADLDRAKPAFFPNVSHEFRASLLPRGEPAASDAGPAVAGAPAEEDARSRVLIADANADMRDYLVRILGALYAVEAVGDGSAALERAAARVPDLVIADVMMPRLDGFGLLAGLRGDERIRGVPVILLSARAGEAGRIEGLAAGADEYLVKPFSARELMATVASQLQLARLRRDAAQALQHRRDQFKTLLEQAPLGVYLVDADFRVRDVNPVAHATFGDVPGGVVGRDFSELTHALWEQPYADEMVRIFRSTLETGEPYISHERAERRIDRDVVERYEWRLDRITLPDGRFGLVCYFRDVSERQEARAAAAYLAAIVDSADDAIISKDLDGIIQSCNAAAERLFGYPAAEMVGRPVRMLIPAERQPEEDEILARLRRGEQVAHFETVRIAKGGRRLDVSLTVSPVRDATGRIIGASKIARDITAAKLIEAERIRLLRENAAIMETLNDVGAIVASELDQPKVIQAVTDAATELTTAQFGAFFYNVPDEAGESYALYTISGAPREAFSQFPMPRNTELFEPTFKGTSVVRSADVTGDPRYGHNPSHHGMPLGHLPVRSYLAVPVKARDGEVIGGLFFGHSEVGRFTEHHERLAVGVASWASVAIENARLYMSIQEASRLKDEFLASLSHELRTPLNAILGYARMMKSGIVAPARQQKAVETIERNATSLTQIVEDVLDVSRIVSGKIRLNVQTVDFPEVVRSAVDGIAPAADAKGIAVETVIDPHASPISGDPERLLQILWNLLSNAVKFTNKGGKIQVRLERVDSHVQVSVSDTGVGISPQFLLHVFERFRQADAGTARERGGLGLGLSIARQLAEMHGGSIEAASGGTGQGSTFRLKLPLMIVRPKRDEARNRVQARGSRRQVPANDLRNVHVLTVDDDRDALSLVAEVLEAAGARVTTANSTDEAMTRLSTEVPAVLVADLGMPHADGFELIKRIRRHLNPRVRELPAAALTAYARSDDRVRALRAGFHIHLAKPIDPAELVATIAALAKRFMPRSPSTSPEHSI